MRSSAFEKFIELYIYDHVLNIVDKLSKHDDKVEEILEEYIFLEVKRISFKCIKVSFQKVNLQVQKV